MVGANHYNIVKPQRAEHPYELYSFGSGGKKGKNKISAVEFIIDQHLLL